MKTCSVATIRVANLDRRNIMGHEREIYECLKELGAGPNLDGYHYTSWILNNMFSGNISKFDKQMYVYAITAKHFSTTPSRVERAIRHMVDSVFKNASIDVLYKYFGNTVSYDKGKVTNGQLIACIFEYIRIDINTRNVS
jgi:two-component system response regulator (stage 0 sporulation protein A)